MATSGNPGNTSSCSTGGDNGQSLASYLTSTTGNVTTGNDQTGNSNSPTGSVGVGLACNGSIYCWTLSGSQSLDYSSFSDTRAQPFTLYVVLKRTGGTGSASYALATYPLGIGGNNSANQALIYAGGAGQSCAMTDNAWHSLIVVFNGASSTCNVDGAGPTTLAGSPGTGSLTANLGIGDFLGAQYFTGNIEEAIIFPSALSGTAQTNLCHNARLYFSTGGSC